MVFKKPYAFLIKNFKIIHIILCVIIPWYISIICFIRVNQRYLYPRHQRSIRIERGVFKWNADNADVPTRIIADFLFFSN